MSVKVFKGVFPNSKTVVAAILLTAVVCVPICIAGAAYAKAGTRITLLSATATEVDNSGATGQSGQWQTVQMRVTAYCPCEKCCGKYSNGQTACGHKIRPGDAFVAADKKYSFGTKIIIPGYENAAPVKVLDRGGAIRGNRLDVFFGSHEEALKWGVKNLNVKVRRK